MNKRQKKKLWIEIQNREAAWSKAGIIFSGGSCMLGHGWIYNKHGIPFKLV